MSFVAVNVDLVPIIMDARSLWKQVKNAPQDIFDALEDLDQLALATQQIEEQFQGVPGAEWASPSAIKSFENAKANIQAVVKELGAELKSESLLKRKIASVKTIINKEKLQRLEKRLDRSVKLLELSLKSREL